MTFLQDLRSATRSAQTNPYFASYIQNATNDVSKIASVSRVPSDVPLETLVALSTFRPITAPGTVTQTSPQNIQGVQDAIRARLQASNVNITNLSNFVPSIAGNAIQTRGNPTANDRRVNGVLRGLNARQRVLAGLDPKTRKLVEDLQDLKRLRELQAKLEALAARLEQEIIKYTGIFNAIVNGPDAIASAFLTSVINKIELLERSYTSAKNLILLVKKTIENTVRAITKALFKDIPQSIARIRTGFDALTKILKLPEISLRLRFPKRPKFPRMNWTIGDFYQKYRKAFETLKQKNSQFYQKALDTAIQQSGVEIIDPNKDKIQQGLTKARNALKEARAQLQARQAVRNEAINRARTQLIDNIRKTTQVTERERERIARGDTGLQRNAKNAIARAQARLADIAGRRLYLTPEEQRIIQPSSRVAGSTTNAFGDLSYSVNDRIVVTPDGRTVYKDRRTDKLYVIQSPQDRVRELTATSVNRLQANAQEFTAGIGTINTAIATAAEVQATMNSKVLKAEFGINLLQEAQNVNNITREARQSTNEVTQQQNPVLADEFTIDAETRTVTTITRRLSASEATNQATAYNRRTAEFNGYTTPLTIRPSGPKLLNVSGQNVYELVLAITYKNFNNLNQARLEQLGQQQSAVAFDRSTATVGTPITSVPASAPISVSPQVEVPTSQFVAASATPRTSTPAPTPPIATPGFDIDQSQSIFGTPRKLSVFEIEALNNRLASPLISDEEKVRIRQILGVANQLPTDLQLPKDAELEFSQEVTRPNLNVNLSGNTATLSFNARSNSDPRVNVEYSLDNGNTWTAANPPRVSGDIVIPNLDTGIYAARIRGIRADGTTSISSQPKPIVINISKPVQKYYLMIQYLQYRYKCIKSKQQLETSLVHGTMHFLTMGKVIVKL
jgi:flagellar hook-basal body complex protein FliE